MNIEKKQFRKQLYIVFLFNVLALLFQSGKYSVYFENTDSFFTKLYLTLTTFSHFFWIGALPLLLSLVFYIVVKSKKLVTIINIVLSALVLILVQIDTIIFGQFRYHISPIVLKLVFGKRSSDIFQFSTINIIIALLFVIGLIGLQFLFHYLAKKILARDLHLRVKATMFFFISTSIFSHFVYAWSDANYYRPVTQVKKVFP